MHLQKALEETTLTFLENNKFDDLTFWKIEKYQTQILTVKQHLKLLGKASFCDHFTISKVT